MCVPIGDLSEHPSLFLQGAFIQKRSRHIDKTDIFDLKLNNQRSSTLTRVGMPWQESYQLQRQPVWVRSLVGLGKMHFPPSFLVHTAEYFPHATHRVPKTSQLLPLLFWGLGLVKWDQEWSWKHASENSKLMCPTGMARKPFQWLWDSMMEAISFHHLPPYTHGNLRS